MKKTHNLRDEPVLCPHITDNQVKQFSDSISRLFVTNSLSKKHIYSHSRNGLTGIYVTFCNNKGIPKELLAETMAYLSMMCSVSLTNRSDPYKWQA